MGKNNLTIYRNGVNTYVAECMVQIKDCMGVFKTIIPHEWLNTGLDKESVLKWLEIGNNTLFPATMKEVEISRAVTMANLGYGSNNVFGYYMGLRVEPIKIKNGGRHLSNDVNCMPSGELYSIRGSDLDFVKNTRTSKKFNCTCNRLIAANIDGSNPHEVHGSSWGCYISDLQLSETKEPLYDYILRTYDEFSNKKPENIPAYEISIDCSKLASGAHKLGVLTFYRYLHSNRYYGVVKDTLKLVSIGVDPWTALYAALSKYGVLYFDYYSLLQFRGFVDMSTVKANIINLKTTVHSTFSKDRSCPNFDFNWKDNDADLLVEVDRFTKTTFDTPKNVLNMICIAPSKTLIEGKEYKCYLYLDSSGNNFNPLKIKTIGEDYRARNYSRYRFKIKE